MLLESDCTRLCKYIHTVVNETAPPWRNRGKSQDAARADMAKRPARDGLARRAPRLPNLLGRDACRVLGADAGFQVRLGERGVEAAGAGEGQGKC